MIEQIGWVIGSSGGRAGGVKDGQAEADRDHVTVGGKGTRLEQM